MKRVLFPIFFCAGAMTVSAAEQKHYFVPLIQAVTSTEVIPGSDPAGGLTIRTMWLDNLSAFNTSSVTASVTPVAFYGGFVKTPGDQTVTLAPGTGDQFSRWPWAGIGGPESGPVGFVELLADPGVIVNAGVEKAQFCSGCVLPDRVGGETLVSQGRSAMPVFESLFPAGASVICGEVNLGAPRQTCGKPPDQQYPRRVNVTLLNAGAQEATFTVQAISLYTKPEPIFELAVKVGAKDVKQVNSVPIPRTENGHVTVDYDTYVWIRITCDQPFLAYVSSVFEGGAQGSMPFEVFTPRIEGATGP